MNAAENAEFEDYLPMFNKLQFEHGETEKTVTIHLSSYPTCKQLRKKESIEEEMPITEKKGEPDQE